MRGSTMSIPGRDFSPYASDAAQHALSDLLTLTSDPEGYREKMTSLGCFLGGVLNDRVKKSASCLVASTAEDADYLSQGVMNSLAAGGHKVKAAVFWNNHYSIPGGSIAPIVHKFLQPGYEQAESLVVVKSVISGSCVVRTNILELIEKLIVEKIYIVSPVMHEKSEEALRREFPDEVSRKFEFIFFAIDKTKDASGEVKPGIGGQIYELLGMKDQPARTSFMPKLVLKSLHVS